MNTIGFALRSVRTHISMQNPTVDVLRAHAFEGTFNFTCC